jgi:hypothetical protein
VKNDLRIGDIVFCTDRDSRFMNLITRVLELHGQVAVVSDITGNPSEIQKELLIVLPINMDYAIHCVVRHEYQFSLPTKSRI